MAEPNIVAAGVRVPQAISHWRNIKTFVLGGKFIAASFIAAILLGSLPVFGGVTEVLIMACFAAGLCLVAYRLELRLRRLVVAFAAVGLILTLIIPVAAKPAYGAGLAILNPIVDPAHRWFWPDPEHVDFPDRDIFVRTNDGVTIVDMTTEAGRKMAYSGVMMDGGEQALFLASGVLMGIAALLAALGSLSRLTGLTNPAVSTAPGLFDNISRYTRTGLIILCIGGLPWGIGLAVQEILQWFSPHDTYRVVGAADPDPQRFWLARYVLERVVFLGFLLMSTGLVVILAGGPRRALFRWFDRRAQGPGGKGFDAPLKKAGVLLFALGMLAFALDEHILRGQIIPTFRDVRNATSDAWAYELPAWLDVMWTITGFWVLPTILGILGMAAGSKTVRLILSLILSLFGASFKSGGATTSTSSSAGNRESSEARPSSSGGTGEAQAQGDNGLTQGEIAGGANSSRMAGR